MSTTLRTVFEPPAGFASERGALLFWALAEQRKKLIAETRELTVEDLDWQFAPGMNTIGMLLAHVAFAEAHLVQVGVLGETTGHAQDVIGITEEDEGLPLPPDGRPSPAVSGKPVAFFHSMLDRSHAHTRAAVAPLTDADLARIVTRPPRPDGTVRVLDAAWVLYHLVEHEAGHLGQISLLRHLRRASAR